MANANLLLKLATFAQNAMNSLSLVGQLISYIG